MQKKQRAYPVTVSGLDVLVVELTPSQLTTAMKNAGVKATGIAVTREALRMSIKEIEGVEVKYADLAGAGWRKHLPRTRYTMGLARAFNQIHLPDDDETEAVVATMAVEVNAEDVELWTVTLPGGRAVVLAEVTDDTVAAAMQAAEKASKSIAAQSILATIGNVRKSLHSIDGKRISPDDSKGKKWDQLFSVRETYLLGAAWNEIHIGDVEGSVTGGEAKPLSGIA